MSLAEQVAEMLGRGADVRQVTQAFGIDNQTLYDLISTPEYKAKVREMTVSRFTRALQLDDVAVQAEEKVLVRLYNAIDLENDPAKLAKIYQILNKSGKRINKPEEQGLRQDEVAVVVLPTSVAESYKPVEYEVDAQGQVVSVDGRALVTMGSTGVKQLAARMNPRLAEIFEEQAAVKAISEVRLEDL